MAISSNHTTAQLQSATSSFNFIKIPSPPGGTINSSYSIGAYPTVILIKPDKQIIEKDIWPIDNTILRNKITSAGGIAQSCGSASISDLNQNSEVLFYPNPATNYLNIEYSNTSFKKYSLEIFNLVGESIKQIELSSNNGELKESVSLKGLKNGNYYIKLTANGQLIYTHKFLVIK